MSSLVEVWNSYRCAWKHEDAKQDSSELEEYRQNRDSANQEERCGRGRLVTERSKIKCHGGVDGVRRVA